MQRRHWLMGGVAVAAAGAGVYLQTRSSGTADAPASAEPGVAVLTPADAAVWAMQFETPDGGTLAMASLKGRPLLLNFWATWCPPCIKELPLLDRFAREHAGAGWQVLGLAIDRRDPVREFLQRQPVGFHIALAGVPGAELLRTLGNGAGALPYTVTFDASGAARHRKLGEVTPAELTAWGSARS